MLSTAMIRTKMNYLLLDKNIYQYIHFRIGLHKDFLEPPVDELEQYLLGSPHDYFPRYSEESEDPNLTDEDSEDPNLTAEESEDPNLTDKVSSKGLGSKCYKSF